ncbi:MAG: uroporphyrinogen-III C-methyltransferase [Pseudomonadota bacterium]
MPLQSLDTAVFDFPDFPPGEVWLAGAGPGDPRLLTLLVLHALKTADIIIHDALVDHRILTLVRPDAELMLAGKRGGQPSAKQGDINQRLIDLARKDKRVLRLKGGDPFVFGRGGEEALALVEAGVPFRVIPGVTAGLSGLALAGIPATTRDTNHAVILASGHRAVDTAAVADWIRLAQTGQPIVMYMAIANLAGIVAAFLDAGLASETPVAIVCSATTRDERVLETRLGDVVKDSVESDISAPAIVVIGAPAGLRSTFLKTMVRWE